MCIDVNELRALSTETQRKQAEAIISGLPDQLRAAAQKGERSSRIIINNDSIAKLVDRYCKKMGLRTNRRGQTWGESPMLDMYW